MDQPVCPKGHLSTEADYCSECGARMQPGSAPAIEPAAQSIAGPEHCPDCGTPRDQHDIAFCEICGYNFVTGAHGDLSAIAPVDPLPPEPQTTPAHAATWSATLAVDSALHEAGSPEPPEDIGPFVFPIAVPVSLIGRRSEARGIFPEIPIQHDDAVSHRHALLQLDPAGALTVRDIGSSNGTRLNGTELTRMVDYPLQDGDVIAFGHWSTLTLARGTSQAEPA